MGSSAARTVDPPFTAGFVFTIDGIEIGRFTEVTGLAVTLGVEEITEGGRNDATVKLPGRLTWPNLVLKRGVTDDDQLLQWITKVSKGLGTSVDRSTGSITLLDNGHRSFRRWNFHDALPIRWTGPQLAASGNTLATEELEVCHGGFVTA